MKIETQNHGYRNWSAIDADTYDGAPDATIQFIGRGETEEEAIEDLKILIQDDFENRGPDERHSHFG